MQTVVLASLLIFGGAIRQAETIAYKSFDNTVNNRRDYLQQDMRNRWTNIGPYLTDIRKNLSKPTNLTNEIFENVIDDLIQMLSTTETTGVYVFLQDSDHDRNIRPGIYLRDYEPLSNSSKNDDIYMVVGPPEIAEKYKMPLDSNWQYSLTLNSANSDFFYKPLQYLDSSPNQIYLGYWSQPFKITEKDNVPIITYSMPIQNINNQTIGIIGIELSTNYLTKFLPSTDLQTKEPLGYIIAGKNTYKNSNISITDNDDVTLDAIITTTNIQKRFIDSSDRMSFQLINDEYNVYLFNNIHSSERIHASIAELNVYPYTSPFQDEKWYLVGFMRSNDLLDYANRIISIIISSILISLIFGTIGGIIVSRQMSRPVIKLVGQVIKADKSKALTLMPSGLSELDELSQAMMQTNKLMLDSASRLSRIIEMVDLPIAAFEISESSDDISITGKLFDILEIEAANQHEFTNKNTFRTSMEKLFSTKETEAEEENIFRMTHTKQDKWIRVRFNNLGKQGYGVIQDVTNEILEKKRIILERDIDPLTKLLNRKSFQFKFDQWYEQHLQDGMTKVAALIMFDLDFLKTVNDTYGHKWGDFYISEASLQLQTIAPPEHNILARRSGDEFVMLLHSFDTKDDVRELLVNFYKNIDRYELDFPDGKRNIEISAGFIWIENNEFNFDQLLHYADEALYNSKQQNKGYFTESIIQPQILY